MNVVFIRLILLGGFILKRVVIGLLGVVLGLNIRVYASENQLGFVNVIGDVPEYRYDAMIENYMLVPESIRESFQLDGWTLSITTENLEDTWFRGWNVDSIASGIDSDLKEIRVESTRNGTSAVVHEMGHYVDWKLGNISSTYEWKNIWKQETVSKYGSTSSLEGFAEAFEQLYYNEDSFKKNYPSSYEFIKSHIGEICSID